MRTAVLSVVPVSPRVAAALLPALLAALLAVAGGAPVQAAGDPGTVRHPVTAAGLRAGDDGRTMTRAEPAFEGALELVAQRRQGAPFAEHELEILDAWRAGLPVAQIEAETLLSGAIYRLFVAGARVTEADRDRIERWRAYRAAHAREIVGRAARLAGGRGAALREPDGSRDWELYWDPELYNQLSGAFRNRLRRLYGARTRPPGEPVELEGGGEAAPAAVAALTNVLVNDPTADATTQDTQSETSLVLGAGSNVLVSFNDSGSEEGGAAFTGIARSTNGGTSFTDQGALPASASGDAGDPVYARNATTGRIILSTLGFNSSAVLQCFRSDDNGASYQAPVDCDGGGASNDKEWLAADNFAGTGQGNFYLFYRDFGGGGGMSFTRSTDGGSTWSPRLLLASTSGQGAWTVVGADHAVYAFWLDTGNVIVMRKSTDQGQNFGTKLTVADVRSTGVNGDFGLNGGFRSNCFPQVVAHPTDPNQLYMTWTDNAVGSSDKTDVFLTRTTDGGTTWTAPIRVNEDTGTHDNWQPVIAIAPDGSGLFVSWYDRRLDVANLAIDVYGRNFQIDGTDLRYGGDYRITDTSFPVVVGQDGVIVSTYMGDYDQAVADSTSYYRTWGDNRLARLTHAHQPDVRFVEIPHEEGYGPSADAVGHTFVLDGCAADNGVPDPGELVDVDLTVRNQGTTAFTQLVGTLLPTGGVASPSAPRTFGGLQPGESATRRFVFTVGAGCNDELVLSLALEDGAVDHGVVEFGPQTFGSESVSSFSNGSPIAINDSAAASPYPSTLSVSGVGDHQRVTLELFDLSHTFPEDVDIVAVAPTGAKAYVLSDIGGGTDVSNADLVFDDQANALVPNPIVAGTWRPSNIDTSTDALPGPAPAGPFDTTFAGLSALGGAANGTWSLYVRDDVGTDSGSIAGGWRVNVHTRVCAAPCGNLIFADDFETQAVCRWSGAQGSAAGC